MKQFTFLAKQGQGPQVADLLAGQGMIAAQVKYNGARGAGIMVKAELPANVSKRSVDRMLHSSKVLGAKKRANRFKVFRVEYYDEIAEKIGLDVPFIQSTKLGGKRVLRKVVLRYRDYGCTCCGGYYDLEAVK